MSNLYLIVINNYMMNYYGEGLGWMMPFGFGIFGFVFMIAWWGLIIWAIVAFVRWISQSSGKHLQRPIAQRAGVYSPEVR